MAEVMQEKEGRMEKMPLSLNIPWIVVTIMSSIVSPQR
jgi:hypothetical protein